MVGILLELFLWSGKIQVRNMKVVDNAFFMTYLCGFCFRVEGISIVFIV